MPTRRGLIPGLVARPADVFLRNWNRGQDAALDVTVISPVQAATVDREAENPGYALQFAWDRKMRSAFDVCDAQRISFIPLPVETFGGWHVEAIRQIGRLGGERACQIGARGPNRNSRRNHSKNTFFNGSHYLYKRVTLLLLLCRSTDIRAPDLLGNY